MDREELVALTKDGPVRITMNSGDTVELTSSEKFFVSSLSVYALVRCDDGKLRGRLYPLVAISKAEVFSRA